MFIAALFTIAITRKQPKCPPTDDWPGRVHQSLVISAIIGLGAPSPLQDWGQHPRSCPRHGSLWRVTLSCPEVALGVDDWEDYPPSESRESPKTLSSCWGRCFEGQASQAHPGVP
ncbi:hypothetical protein Cadr_000024088 [Camelus dromedarius]|uniref:Uncharacterized protein n=1 Tax=Camelus dromedarius TaxID=9838 RepID=A0A5N4CXS2_CAMDR|nr:hypothetical protein Cadr_000024088 [Camelus dromedarius]